MLRILAIDIGGTHIKLLASGQRKPVEIPSGRTMTPQKMFAAVKQATADWEYEVVSIGYPGVVVKGHPLNEAPNLGNGWVKFNYKKAFGCPVKIINDAAMQALGSYRGGRMLFLGLGTGLGSAWVMEGFLHPLQLGDLPYREGRSYGEYIGKAGLERLGQQKWCQHVLKVVAQLRAAMQPDYVLLGGGKVELLKTLPPATIRGGNSKAFVGGFRLWQKDWGYYAEPLVRG